MIYFKGTLVAVGGRNCNRRHIKCSVCGEEYSFVSVTIDYKNVCDSCRNKDEKAEETDKKYGEGKNNE